jgi:hypothetical protein
LREATPPGGYRRSAKTAMIPEGHGFSATRQPKAGSRELIEVLNNLIKIVL